MVGWVAPVIIVSAQVLLILTLGLWDFGLGLDNIVPELVAYFLCILLVNAL